MRILNAVVFLFSFVWSCEYLFNLYSDILGPPVPCSSKRGNYHDGRMWFSEYTEPTLRIKEELLDNFTACLPDLVPTHLQSKIFFHDEQIQYFASDLEGCIDPEPMLLYVQRHVCQTMGLPFYLSHGPHRHWMLVYNNLSSYIHTHVDNDFLENGLTVGMTLDSGDEVHECRDGSILTRTDKINFIPHVSAPHHTPKLVNGTRIVYQLRGSTCPFDYPVHFLFRKIKNMAYLGVMTLLPDRFITLFKQQFNLTDVYSIPLPLSLSLDYQQMSARFLSTFGHVLGHYGMYISKSMFGISVITQLILYYQDVWVSEYTFLGLHVAHLLWVCGFKRLGASLMYTSLLVGSVDSTVYMIGHLIGVNQSL